MKVYEQKKKKLYTTQHPQQNDHDHTIVRVHSTFTELVCTHTS